MEEDKRSYRSKLLCGVVLIEGADYSGKTTLAEALVERFNAYYLHGRIFRRMWLYHVAMLRLALRMADTRLVVIDRHWLSELIYGEVYRGGPAYDLGARCLDRVLMRVGAVTVLCSPDDQEYQIKRHAARAARGEEAYRQIQRVVAIYADLARGNHLHPTTGYLGQQIRYGDFAQRKDVMLYDLDKSGHQLPQVAKQIAARVRKLQAGQLRSALFSSMPNFTGNLATARTVIVGDSVSPQVARLPKGPYWPMAWHDGPSGATYLNRALHLIGHDETTTVITNANDEDDQLTPLLRESKLRIVTLGKRATDGVLKRGATPDAEIEHPQYWRRFHYGEIDEYASRLKKALNP